MTFSEYFKQIRTERGISQRELAEKSGLSNSEISRIETGERKKPSHISLKAVAPWLSVPYEELLKKAGYIEEIVDYPGYTENIIRDEDGNLIDIVPRIKDMYEKNSKWANLAYRVSSSDLTESEINAIEASTNALLEEFLKNKKK